MTSARVRTPPGTDLQGSRRFNTVLATACLVLAVALPAATVYGLAAASPAAWLAGSGVPQLPAAVMRDWHPARWQWFLAWLLGTLPVCCAAVGMYCAHRCFRGFARGRTFSLGTVRQLRGLAAGMLASAVAGLLSPVLISVVLTIGAPAGQRAVALNVDSQQVLMLLFSGIVLQVARVMTQAVAIAEDHAQIV